MHLSPGADWPMDGEDFPPLKKNELSTAEAPVGRAHCIFCRQKVLLSRGAGWPMDGDDFPPLKKHR